MSANKDFRRLGTQLAHFLAGQRVRRRTVRRARQRLQNKGLVK